VNKKALSESDICDRFITPAIERAGWTSDKWRREFSFTDGKMIVRGKMVARGKPRRADYLLFHTPNRPIAVIEAKDNKHSVRAGMQQGLDYAERLDVPFVFASNGDGFVLHDKTGTYPATEMNISLDDFPTPAELWRRYKIWRKIDDEGEALVSTPNHSDASGKQPRYYQQLAINRTIEAVAAGQKRALLVMATGTGKTYTAFNIIWRLWKSGQAKRILFLADRNILVDQTMVNDFSPFGEAMTKLTRKLVDKGSGNVDQSYEIYLSLYQAIVGDDEHPPIYDKFPKDFFDLIVIDECHRGSAREDSAWREILDHFDSATQVGMTATPKETKYVSNIDYFGKPVYTYSLKQGIDDGFLAPFKVIRIDLDKDVLGWRPEKFQEDDFGFDIPDRIYNQLDFDRDITFPGRTKMVAERIAAHMHADDPMHKAIVFCEDIDHAERMRQALVNIPENKGLVEQDHRYVMRITGDEMEGKAQLDNFIDPKRSHPVIATTSKLMTTGVDAQTCHTIVLDQRIKSLTEFKQIIGRGTRLRTDYEKYFFTILDFRKATELFADPDWDGPPLQDDDFGAKPEPKPDEEGDEPFDPDDIDVIIFDPDPIVDGSAFPEKEGRRRYIVSGVEFSVLAERVQYYDKDGKLVTESLRDHTRRTVSEEFSTLDDFVKRWTSAERKQVIVDELLERGVLIEALEEAVAPDMDAFDLICHVVFDRPPLTRRERADEVRKRDLFTKYGDTARAVLDALLEKYADQGIDAIEDVSVLKVNPLSELGTITELVRSFGGKAEYDEAVQTLEAELYKSAN